MPSRTGLKPLHKGRRKKGSKVRRKLQQIKRMKKKSKGKK